MGWYVVTALEQAEDRYEKTKAEYLEAVAENPAYATEWKLAGMIEAQALYQIATEFDGDYSRENLDRWARSTSHALTMVRGESRSTSGASNLVEDIRQATKLNLLGKYYEAVEGEESLTRSEAKHEAEIRQVGQAVRYRGSEDTRASACMVTHKDRHGLVEMVGVFPGINETDVASVQADPHDLVVTQEQPYRKVQLAWERLADSAEITRQQEDE
jgi:hypothetical protein